MTSKAIWKALKTKKYLETNGYLKTNKFLKTAFSASCIHLPKLGCLINVLLDSSIERARLENLVTHDKQHVDLMTGSQIIELRSLESLSYVVQF